MSDTRYGFLMPDGKFNALVTGSPANAAMLPPGWQCVEIEYVRKGERDAIVAKLKEIKKLGIDGYDTVALVDLSHLIDEIEAGRKITR